jgi:Yeast PIR protein repeat
VSISPSVTTKTDINTVTLVNNHTTTKSQYTLKWTETDFLTLPKPTKEPEPEPTPTISVEYWTEDEGEKNCKTCGDDQRNEEYEYQDYQNYKKYQEYQEYDDDASALKKRHEEPKTRSETGVVVNEITDGQIQATNQPPAVPNPVAQPSNPEQPNCTGLSCHTIVQLADGQIQALKQPNGGVKPSKPERPHCTGPNCKPVNQIGDGQIQAPEVPRGNGEGQKPCGEKPLHPTCSGPNCKPVHQIGDGQVQTPCGEGEVQQPCSAGGKKPECNGPNCTTISQISDGQIQVSPKGGENPNGNGNRNRPHNYKGENATTFHKPMPKLTLRPEEGSKGELSTNPERMNIGLVGAITHPHTETTEESNEALSQGCLSGAAVFALIAAIVGAIHLL